MFLSLVETGQVDIVIGTHRLLSKDVKFHDLGLLVVDEEQRFGVAHKERLKELKLNVDVLTLSATPIPRTLNMSLVGLRDMSVIETPPKDRLAIQTVVAPFTESLIRRAIDEEMSRQGQVFFVHNRVETIYAIADLVSKLVPKARVVVGHGQMNEKELEAVMFKFVRGEADVLVCTTIVENGLDIPAANTILINRADRFGLSELYQLRGRVGRSNQRAYAYLLVPEDVVLTPLATRRLAALKGIQRARRGIPRSRAGPGIARRGKHAGRTAARAHQRHRLRPLRADAGAGRLDAEGRRSQIRNARHDQPWARYPHPRRVHPQRESAFEDVQADCRHHDETEREEVNSELTDRFGAPPSVVGNLLDYALLKGLAEGLMISPYREAGQRSGHQVSSGDSAVSGKSW